MEKTFIHQYTCGCAQQLKQRSELGEPKQILLYNPNKFMGTDFWDMERIIFIDYLKKGITPNEAQSQK